jgi:hypothetical protein
VSRGTGAYLRGWRQAAKSARWSAFERVYRASALDIADIASVDGLVCVRREVLAASLGLSDRAVTYHLAWLVEHGWLERASPRGSKSQPSAYRLTIPSPQLPQPVAHETVPAGVTESSQLRQRSAGVEGANSRKSLGELNGSTPATPLRTHIDRASVSEHDAVKEDAPGETTTTELATAPPSQLFCTEQRTGKSPAGAPRLADSQTAAATSKAPHTERGEVVEGPQRDGDDPARFCVLCGDALYLIRRGHEVCGRCEHAQLVASSQPKAARAR